MDKYPSEFDGNFHESFGISFSIFESLLGVPSTQL